MAFRRTTTKLCTVLIQPLHYASDPNDDVPGFRKAGKGNQGAQFGTSAAPASQRPFVYDGPTNVPYWHHVADIWRPKQKRMSFPGEHHATYDGGFDPSPQLIAVRPILKDIARHRNHESGPAVALERWEGVKKGAKEGIFDTPCLHRAGFYVLDVLAEHKDIDGCELIYMEMHDPVAKGGLGLDFDTTHLEKAMLCAYRSANFSKGISFMEEALFQKGVAQHIKTQTYAIAMACYGRELEAAKGIELWNKYVFLGRDVASFPYYQLAELVMGCIEPEDVAAAKLILRNFNDFYIEKVWNACRQTGVDNEPMIYYTEWLFKARRQVILDPAHNYHFLQYALKRATQ
eukprot:TRINITY_DN6649_c0_g1_i1.p1 TRINITY_DN6649_c0_g1~~TRINITY_DN6649_c0_g1_i1.p1  ORF type:complete len:345 (+),score=73.22 TRINITY_DN6649_c0_g1_i1:42-1076(+)